VFTRKLWASERSNGVSPENFHCFWWRRVSGGGVLFDERFFSPSGAPVCALPCLAFGGAMFCEPCAALYVVLGA